MIPKNDLDRMNLKIDQAIERKDAATAFYCLRTYWPRLVAEVMPKVAPAAAPPVVSVGPAPTTPPLETFKPEASPEPRRRAPRKAKS